MYCVRYVGPYLNTVYFQGGRRISVPTVIQAAVSETLHSATVRYRNKSAHVHKVELH